MVFFQYQSKHLKMDYNSELWFGSLAALIIYKCTGISIQRCPGCKAKLHSSLLHQHEQLALLDKINLHFDEVRGEILSSIDTIYENIKSYLPHSPDRAKDKEIYCNNASVFLRTASADSIYWGRYIDEHTDSMIYKMFFKKTR